MMEQVGLREWHSQRGVGLPLGITRCGELTFHWGERTYIMGVINVTPDSFSGDGCGGDIEAAVAQAQRFAAEGADIIDIGGESTRPESVSISVEEELHRVIPVVERLTTERLLPLSIDTYKAEVARRALDAGAQMVNDVWGLKRDRRLAKVAAEKGVPIVITSNQRDTTCRDDIMAEVISSLKQGIDAAREAGLSWNNIIVDPGIGFGKTLEQNLEILRRLGELRSLRRPILLGTSRKSMIGLVLDLPPDQRVEGTAATVAIGIAKGADIVRVHDISQMVRVCRMSDAVIRGHQSRVKLAEVYLGLGSNLGDRQGNIAKAIALLAQKVRIEGVSSLYETEPVGYQEQPFFLNAVCRISTEMSPQDLLALVKEIENSMGRVSSFPNAPRVIDVDVLFYGDQVIENEELIIPHPRLAERAFVLVPLAEIASDLLHPLMGKSIAELLPEAKGLDTVRRL